jgi:uncharacterized protein YecT (DUF1311 family)
MFSLSVQSTFSDESDASNSKNTGEECISTAQSTFHLMECYRELSNQEDVRLQVKLNNIYQEYPKLAPKIKQSYQHWLTYRESHCSLVYDAWGDGSARQYAYGKCLYKMSKDWSNPMYINYK